MKSRKARRIKEEMNACCTLLARIRETARETESESERERVCSSNCNDTQGV